MGQAQVYRQHTKVKRLIVQIAVHLAGHCRSLPGRRREAYVLHTHALRPWDLVLPLEVLPLEAPAVVVAFPVVELDAWALVEDIPRLLVGAGLLHRPRPHPRHHRRTICRV